MVCGTGGVQMASEDVSKAMSKLQEVADFGEDDQTQKTESLEPEGKFSPWLLCNILSACFICL